MGMVLSAALPTEHHPHPSPPLEGEGAKRCAYQPLAPCSSVALKLEWVPLESLATPVAK